MQTYLVGGAIRDRMLGLETKDKDWVVVNATPKDLITKGFIPIGKDFPVFLHPKTKEEYALARTERKSGYGYKGFTFYTGQDVTIEADLARRDLTINAIAEDNNGNLIDPYNGIGDIKNKILRHTTNAFIEDPVRILRIARFKAYLAKFNFNIAPETLQLMKTMVVNGEVNHLVANRVWNEIEKSMLTPAPQIFFYTLQDCGALEAISTELANLISANAITNMIETSKNYDNPKIRFASLFIANSENLVARSELLRKITNKLKIPKSFSEIAKLVLYCSSVLIQYPNIKNIELLSTLNKADAFRRPERFNQVLATIMPIINTELISKINNILYECSKIIANDLIKLGYKGKMISDKINEQRLKIIDKSL